MTANADKSVLVTGCSSGIGRCIALGLANRGYRVFATVRQQKDVEALTRDGLESLQLDLSAPASVDQAVSEVLRRTGGELYALINNGAYGQHGAVEDLSRDVLRAQFETNLFGTHELTVRLMPVFRQQGAGRIVQISSILGLVCLIYRGAYNASKYALEALSDTMRLELQGTGIFVSLIEPGPIESRFRANAHRYYQANIDREHSAHRESYRKVEHRLGSDEDVPFTLPAAAVLDKVIHALESPNPRIRYLVTVPAHGLARLKRWLPDRWMDRFIRRFAG
jgi:NAD(P)-dependent dehydrogenase (short-subunit alcohol dehydrogenase family)